MKNSIDRAIASITEDRRAGYLFCTRTATQTLNIDINKFGDWWWRTRGKLIDLAAAQPAETAAEMMAILAEAASRRSQKG